MSIAPERLNGVVANHINFFEVIHTGRGDGQFDRRVRFKEDGFAFAPCTRTLIAQSLDGNHGLNAVAPPQRKF